MTRNQLPEHCRAQYASLGPTFLTFDGLQAEPGLYANLYQHGLGLKQLVRALGLANAYQTHKDATWERHRNGAPATRWTWPRITERARQIATERGFLPPAQWFQQNH